MSALVHTPARPATTPLEVEVHVDFDRPWCLIGKRQLDAAVRRFEALVPEARVAVTWRSCELLPDTPSEGLDYETFYIRRLGSADAVAWRRLQVREAGRAAGVDFAFERIRRLPNTARAHALLAQAVAHAGPGPAARLVERVLTAFFLEGEDIGQVAVLERLGRESGLPETVLASAGASLRDGSASGRDPRGGGVPFFVFDRARAVSGAVPVGTLLEALLAAWQARAARSLSDAK
jgi:predicted DsbA family dithiol-disulfide isomerase